MLLSLKLNVTGLLFFYVYIMSSYTKVFKIFVLVILMRYLIIKVRVAFDLLNIGIVCKYSIIFFIF